MSFQCYLLLRFCAIPKTLFHLFAIALVKLYQGVRFPFFLLINYVCYLLNIQRSKRRSNAKSASRERDIIFIRLFISNRYGYSSSILSNDSNIEFAFQIKSHARLCSKTSIKIFHQMNTSIDYSVLICDNLFVSFLSFRFFLQHLRQL